MAVQQNKASKKTIRQRRAANRYEGIQTSPCPSCGAARRPHRVCLKCGKYGDRQVISITAE